MRRRVKCSTHLRLFLNQFEDYPLACGVVFGAILELHAKPGSFEGVNEFHNWKTMLGLKTRIQ